MRGGSGEARAGAGLCGEGTGKVCGGAGGGAGRATGAGGAGARGRSGVGLFSVDGGREGPRWAPFSSVSVLLPRPPPNSGSNPLCTFSSLQEILSINPISLPTVMTNGSQPCSQEMTAVGTPWPAAHGAGRALCGPRRAVACAQPAFPVGPSAAPSASGLPPTPHSTPSLLSIWKAGVWTGLHLR